MPHRLSKALHRNCRARLPDYTVPSCNSRNTQDIIQLCTASPTDPLYKEAIHFCHGYLVGVYQYQQDFYSNPGLSPLVCPPNPKPSRNQTIADYVEWVKAHPEYLKERAVDTVIKFLIEKFPCTD